MRKGTLSRGSIYNRFLMLTISIIVLPALIAFIVLSEIMINNLSQSNKTVLAMTAKTVSNTVEEALNSVLDTSISLIGNTQIQEYLAGDGNFTALTQASEVIKDYYLWNHYISQIQICSLDGKKMVSTNSTNTVSFTDDEIKRLEQTNGAWIWTDSNGDLSICRVIRNGLNVKERWGYLKVILDRSKVEQLLRISTADADFECYLFDRGKEHTFFAPIMTKSSK